AVRNARVPGRYPDGAGLSLIVSAPNRRHWQLRYQRAGKAREMSLGNADHVTLAEAREKAMEAHKQLSLGIDPLDARQAERVVETATPVHVVTFAEAAERFIASNEAGWKNPKHRQQWRNTLATYAKAISAMPVADVDTKAVLAVLE